MIGGLSLVDVFVRSDRFADERRGNDSVFLVFTFSDWVFARLEIQDLILPCFFVVAFCGFYF